MKPIFVFLLILGLVCGESPKLKAQTNTSYPYCDWYERSNRTTILLIDVTSPIDPSSEEHLKNGMKVLLSELRKGDRIRIQTMSGSVSSNGTMINRCLPGCYDPNTEDCMFCENPCKSINVLKDTQKLRTEIERAVQNIINTATLRDNVDVIGSLHSFAESFGQSIDKLIIFSNMIHRKDKIDFSVETEESFDRIYTHTVLQGLIPNLHGKEVIVFGLSSHRDDGRLSQVQHSLIVKFWEDYFDDAQVKPIMGLTYPEN